MRRIEVSLYRSPKKIQETTLLEQNKFCWPNSIYIFSLLKIFIWIFGTFATNMNSIFTTNLFGTVQLKSYMKISKIIFSHHSFFLFTKSEYYNLGISLACCASVSTAFCYKFVTILSDDVFHQETLMSRWTQKFLGLANKSHLTRTQRLQNEEER